MSIRWEHSLPAVFRIVLEPVSAEVEDDQIALCLMLQHFLDVIVESVDAATARVHDIVYHVPVCVFPDLVSNLPIILVADGWPLATVLWGDIA